MEPVDRVIAAMRDFANNPWIVVATMCWKQAQKKVGEDAADNSIS